MITKLEKIANLCRDKLIDIAYISRASHVGSCLSCIDILTTLFELKYSDSKIEKIILSKGHAALALYSVANVYGLLSDDILETYNKKDILCGHVSKKPELPFIDWSTGSLGHGLSVAAGMAYINKNILKNNQHVVCVCSDGELQEGSMWEAIMFASHHMLNNLILIVDQNNWQAFGKTKDINNIQPLLGRFEAFNWKCRIRDGHNINELYNIVLEQVLLQNYLRNKPLCVIAKTIKGKGIKSIEDTLDCHYKSLTQHQYEEYKNIHIKEKK